MALHWDITAIPDEIKWDDAIDDDGKPVFDEETGERKKMMSSITNALIWATLSVGLGEITKKNYKKFAARLDLLQNLDGPYMVTHTKHGAVGHRITEKDVKNHIGLSTNVSPETEVGFRKKLSRDDFRRIAMSRDRWELMDLKHRAIKRLMGTDDDESPTRRTISTAELREILDADSVEALFEVLQDAHD